MTKRRTNAPPNHNIFFKTETRIHNGKTLQPYKLQRDGCHALKPMFVLHILEINAKIIKTKL